MNALAVTELDEIADDARALTARIEDMANAVANSNPSFAIALLGYAARVVEVAHLTQAAAHSLIQHPRQTTHEPWPLYRH